MKQSSVGIAESLEEEIGRLGRRRRIARLAKGYAGAGQGVDH